MAKKKDQAPASFQYFAGAVEPQAAPVEEARIADLSEDEQTARNIRSFLERRPPSPWLKTDSKQAQAQAHPSLALPVEEESS